MTQEEYKDYLQSEGWKRRRSWALEFWGNRCAICNSNKNIEVHHRCYDRIGYEQLNDLIALCNHCHTTHHEAMLSLAV